MRRAAGVAGTLDRDGPWGAVGAGAKGAQFAVDGEEGGGDGMIHQHLGQTIDAVAFGDAGQVELQRLMFAGAVVGQIEFEGFVRRAAWAGAGGVDFGDAGLVGAKAPGIDGVAQGCVEGAIRFGPHGEGGLQDGHQAGGQGDPCVRCGGVEAHQVGGGGPGGGDAINLGDRRLQRRLQGGAERLGREGGGPCGAHGRAGEDQVCEDQVCEDQVSRHLRHSGLRLSKGRGSGPWE